MNRKKVNTKKNNIKINAMLTIDSSRTHKQEQHNERKYKWKYCRFAARQFDQSICFFFI